MQTAIIIMTSEGTLLIGAPDGDVGETVTMFPIVDAAKHAKKLLEKRWPKARVAIVDQRKT